MNEEGKVMLKGLLKKILIVVAIAALILGLLPMMYVLLKDDFDRISESNSTYSMVVNSNGQVTYIRTLEDGTTEEVSAEDMAEDFSGVLREYIGGDDEYYNEMINYIIGAEAVTKLPYIEPSEESEGEEGAEESDETTLVGQIKFYRYTSEAESNDAYTTDSEENEILKEEYRLTYVDNETFQSQLASYESGGNAEVFKYFTMDEEGNVVIAYGTKEVRSITTEDADLTQEMVIEAAGGENYTGSYSDGFSLVRYTANEKKIDYLSLVEQYVMPSNLLYALLIQTKDIKFVEAVAELAYNNEIAIGIYDNKSQSITTESYSYKKIMEIDGSTNLDFSNIQTTDPVVRANNLYGSPYSRIPYRCYMNTNNGRITHRLNYYLPSDTPDSEQAAEYMYVTGVDSSGKITSLGTVDQAKVFSTNFYKQINATSIPTVGVILADTWIARWKATYTYQENDPVSSASEGEVEDSMLVRYESKDEVLNAFATTMKNNVTAKLDEHKEGLKQAAIDKIVNSTDFTVTPTTISVRNLSVRTRKDILEDHIDSCLYCQTDIEEWWGNPNTIPDIDDIYEELIDEEGELRETDVEDHYWSELQNYVYNENQRRIRQARQEEERKKEQFTTELENQIGVSQTITGDKLYTNIAFTTSYSRTSSKYEKDETVSTSKEGEKFSEVFNRPQFYEARQGILARDQWLWEYIRENEDTAKLEDMLRYLLNIATNSNKFGTFTAEEIENLFKAFEPKREMTAASYSGLNQLRDYIRMWENAAVFGYINGTSQYTDYVAKYISEDKTVYYIRDDGVGHPTVGFGIDIFNGGFVDEFLAQGYTESQLRDISGSVAVPVEFVDALEEEEIRGNYTSIRERTAGLELETYQVYALVSRAYNCGMSGAMNGYTGINFVDAYVQYYNPETDNRYGEVEADFDHGLYTNFMHSPTSSNGEVLAGLVRRRRSEWTLFQTGYMDTLDEWCQPGGDILETCVIVMEDLMANNVQYSLTNLAWNDIERSNDFSSGIGCCCATYVSVVLYRAELLTEDYLNQYNYNLAIELSAILRDAGWTLVSEEEAEPGDVCVYREHTFIYAGGNEVWDQASGCISSSGNPPAGGTLQTWNYYKDNHDLDVWRRPAVVTIPESEDELPDN